MRWLVKEEPTHYSFATFAKDRRTTWSGVRNPVAQRHLRSMKPGDEVLYYHTGNEKAVVGVATVVSPPTADPADKTGKLYVVELAAGRALPRPVTLAAIKAERLFAESPLARVPRLSVMPITDDQWTWIQQTAAAGA